MYCSSPINLTIISVCVCTVISTLLDRLGFCSVILLLRVCSPCFVHAELSEVKVIRPGMRSGLHGLPLFYQPSLYVTQPQLSIQVQKYTLTISLPQVMSATFLLLCPFHFLSNPITSKMENVI